MKVLSLLFVLNILLSATPSLSSEHVYAYFAEPDALATNPSPACVDIKPKEGSSNGRKMLRLCEGLLAFPPLRIAQIYPPIRIAVMGVGTFVLISEAKELYDSRDDLGMLLAEQMDELKEGLRKLYSKQIQEIPVSRTNIALAAIAAYAKHNCDENKKYKSERVRFGSELHTTRRGVSGSEIRGFVRYLEGTLTDAGASSEVLKEDIRNIFRNNGWGEPDPCWEDFLSPQS